MGEHDEDIEEDRRRFLESEIAADEMPRDMDSPYWEDGFLEEE